MDQVAPRFSDGLELGEALKQFFGGDDIQDPAGGYAARWAIIKMGPWKLAFPNSAARVRALKRHDMHHIAADYDTTFIGEAEIGAWEVAGGCADHWPAWILNLTAMGAGLFLGPLACLRAFARGRHTRNLYRTPYSEVLALGSVGKLRDFLQLRHVSAQPGLTDIVLFSFWSAVGLAITFSMFGLLLSPVAALVWLLV